MSGIRMACNLHRTVAANIRRTRTRSRAINLRFSTRGLTLGDHKSRETLGGTRKALRHRTRQLPVRHTFSLSQRTLLFSRCSLGYENRGPRARGRCSVTHCPFASAYYVLILGIRTYKARNTWPTDSQCARAWSSTMDRKKARGDGGGGWQTRSMKWPTHNTQRVASKFHNKNSRDSLSTCWIETIICGHRILKQFKNSILRRINL